MAKASKDAKRRNHKRQMTYLQKGIVMLPTLREEKSIYYKKGKKR